MRALSLIAWLVWALWVALHYFTIPASSIVLLDGPTGGVAHLGEALARAARAAAGAAVVLVAAWGTGAGVLRAARLPFNDPLERGLLQLALGCAVLAYLLLALAACGVFTRPVVAAVLAAAALTGAAALVSGTRRSPRAPPQRSSPFDLACLACATLAAAFALAAALAPETEYDALWYHLWLPVKWLDAGRSLDIVEEYVSLYPLTWELLYAGAIVVGGPVAAKLLHFVCLPLVGLTTWRLTRQIFTRANAALAAALAMTTPILIWEATTAYIDLALAWYVALGIYGLARWRETRAARWLVLAALMFGAGVAIKHLALVPAAIAAVWIAATELRAARSMAPAIRAVAVFAALTVLVPSPWYLRAWARSGNPVFPEMYGVFGATPESRWNDRTEAGLRRFKSRFGPERTARNLALLPWDMTVHGARYRGTIGPLFLLLVPLALFAGRRARLLMAACAAYLIVWASPIGSFQMRFIVPLVPILAMLAAEGARLVPGAALLAVPLLLVNLPPFVEWHEADRRGYDGWLTHVLRALPLPVVVGAESQERYLTRSVPSYRAWRFIDRTLPPAARVLAFSGGDHLYSSRARLWSDAAAARSMTWDRAAGDEAAVRQRLQEQRITHVLFDRRQLESGEVRALAIGSDAMMACCLDRVYEDNRFVLYRLR